MKFKNNVLKAFLAIAALSTLVSPVAFGDVRLVNQPLTEKTELELFRVTDAFKLWLAAYKEELEAVKSSSMPEAEKAAYVRRIQERVAELLLIHERIVKIAPMAFAINFIVGAEIPLPFTRFKAGVASVYGAGGLTFAAVRSRGNGNLHGVAAGISTLFGPALNLGGRDAIDRRLGASGFKGFFGVAVMLPLNEKLPVMTVGDLQGWYLGGSGELSTDMGVLTKNPGTIQLGVYAKPAGFSIDWPEVGMVMLYRGMGAQNQVVSFSGEALYFGTLVATDDTEFMTPFFSDAKHTRHNRLKALKDEMPTKQEIAERLLKVQKELD